MEHIKVNLPADQAQYEAGCGEGVFMFVEAAAKRAYDTDETGTTYIGILDNDSINYPTLKHGAGLPIEMRGESRPVVPIDYLAEYYGAAAEI